MQTQINIFSENIFSTQLRTLYVNLLLELLIIKKHIEILILKYIKKI